MFSLLPMNLKMKTALKIKVDEELSQKASTDFNDTLLGFSLRKTHQMSFDNRTESRYFKINVSKDAIIL